MIFTIILGSQNNWWITLYTENGCGSIPISTHTMRGTKVQFITDWAQRVNGSYSLFDIGKMWTLARIRVILFSFLPPRWVSVPGFDLQRRDRQTGRRRAAASVGFTVATETVSSLLNTCFWWHHMPGLSTHNERFTSMPSLNPETGHWWVCVRVCVVGGEGVSVITMTKNYWGRNTGMQFISAVNPRRSVGGPPQSSSSDREGYICFCLLCMWLVSLPVFPISAKMLCGREVGELSLLGLIY